MKVLFRTCGGLGNQIYQYYYLFCILQKYSSCNIIHFHSVNYDRYAEHEFPYNKQIIKPAFWELFVIKLRLPTLFRFLGFKNVFCLRFGKLIIIDGYYQTKDSYFMFSKKELNNSYLEMRKLIFDNFTKDKVKGVLFHLRIGDFFDSLSQEREFIMISLKNLKPGTLVISNKDDLITNDIEIQNIFRLYNLYYKNTSQYSSIKLLELFSNFEHIISSGSSLSFAAAIFNNVDISINSMLEGKPLVFYNNLNGLKKYLNNFR
jgi:hypothetical protein